MILPIFFWKFYLFWQISEKVLNIAFYTKVTPPSLFSIFLKCTFDEFVTLGHFRTGDCHPLLKINGCPVTHVTRAGTTPAFNWSHVCSTVLMWILNLPAIELAWPWFLLVLFFIKRLLLWNRSSFLDMTAFDHGFWPSWPLSVYHRTNFTSVFGLS